MLPHMLTFYTIVIVRPDRQTDRLTTYHIITAPCRALCGKKVSFCFDSDVSDPHHGENCHDGHAVRWSCGPLRDLLRKLWLGVWTEIEESARPWYAAFKKFYEFVIFLQFGSRPLWHHNSQQEQRVFFLQIFVLHMTSIVICVIGRPYIAPV